MYLPFAASTFVEVLVALLILIPVTILWITAVVDIFQRPDLHGGKMALWLVAIILFPVFGSLLYFLVRPSGQPLGGFPANGKSASSASQREALEIEQLHKLADLRDRGVIDEAEFTMRRARLIQS